MFYMNLNYPVMCDYHAFKGSWPLLSFKTLPYAILSHV